MRKLNPKKSKRHALKRPHPSVQTLGNILNAPQSEIYKILANYLLENGCPISAKYFQKLSFQEDHFIKTKFNVRKRIRDNHCLLTSIVDNLKKAEIAFQGGDRKSTVDLLVNTVIMIQDQDEDFNWLAKEGYKIIFKIFDNWSSECPLMLCRAYFEYGLLLAEKDVCLDEAITYMEKAMRKCNENAKTIEEEKRDSFLKEVSSELYETLSRAALVYSWVNLKTSAMFAKEAAETIAKTQGFSILYCTAKLFESATFIDDQDYEGALRILNEIEKHIFSNDSPEHKCSFYLNLGLCYFHIFPQNISLALEKFRSSLEISYSYNFVYFKAETLLRMAKIYSYNTTTYGRALRCLIEAKDIYHRLGCYGREGLVDRFIAQLKANRVFPINYLDPIKNAVTDSLCYLFGLITWRKSKLPFWIQDGELRNREIEIGHINSGNENVMVLDD